MSEGISPIQSLVDQYTATFTLLRRSIICFSGEQWQDGISGFEVPVNVAYHTLQCLLYYFRADPEKTYRETPLRFGKDWWELDESDRPDQDAMLAFLDDVEEMVIGRLAALAERDLGVPFPVLGTVLGNALYALRHTMHHQGGLNVLAVHHKIDVDLWDQG
jgi:hypothetical protein